MLGEGVGPTPAWLVRAGSIVDLGDSHSHTPAAASAQADAARIVEALDPGAAIEDAGVALGDLLVEGDHRRVEVALGARLQREMAVTVLAARNDIVRYWFAQP